MEQPYRTDGDNRKSPKEIVRTGYDKVSRVYRGDTLDPEDRFSYGRCLDLLTPHLSPGSRVLDLGCGCGVPVAQELSQEHRVTGVDISPVQIERARRLVPRAEFICADMAEIGFRAEEFDAIVCFYAVIHLPLGEQPALFANMKAWLKPQGWLLCTVGHTAWTGTEENWLGVPGATMFWSHADKGTYETWFTDLGFSIETGLFIPEGDGGHAALLAKSCAGP